MDKKTYLCRYRNLLEKIKKKKQYLDFCDERASSVPGPNYGERINNPNPNTEAPFVRWVFKKIETEEEIEELEKRLNKVKTQIETAINSIQDEELQMILTYRYIDWLSWSDIGLKIYYSDKTIRRKHNQALELLQIDHL